MDNSYFIAPKALCFLFMAFFVRGTFNSYPLNLIKLNQIIVLAKAVAIGFIALGCGIEDNQAHFNGFFQRLFTKIFDTQDS
jgi:hypothetical protein